MHKNENLYAEITLRLVVKTGHQLAELCFKGHFVSVVKVIAESDFHQDAVYSESTDLLSWDKL